MSRLHRSQTGASSRLQRLEAPQSRTERLSLKPLAEAAFSLTLLASLSGCWVDAADTPLPTPTPTPTPTRSVSLTPSLGLVTNADATVVCAPTGTRLGTGSSGSDGRISLTATGDCAGPVLVTLGARADGSSRYYDEALGSNAVFPAGSSMRALAPALSDPLSLAVTPLTEIAVRRALQLAGSLSSVTSSQVSSANTEVVTKLLGSVSLDILTPPTLWSASTGAAALGSSAADRYAFFLGGLAKLAAGAGNPALAITDALATDLADGTLDGATGTGYSYTSSNFSSQLTAGLRTLASFANSDLQSLTGATPIVPLDLTGFSPAAAKAGETVTLTGTGFDSDPFHLEVKFANNLAAEVVSSSSTQIVVKVPAGAVSGVISVRHIVNETQDSSATSFTVQPSTPAPASWTSRASPSGFLFNGLAYGGGTFVAVGFNRSIMTSADGLSWTSRSAPDTDYYDTKNVIWTGSQFVLVGDKNYGGSKPAIIATSPDGITWTRRNWTPSLSSENLADVGVGGGKLTVVGMNGTVASSTDNGLNWTEEKQSWAAAFSGIAGNDSTRVAVGRDSGYNGVILVDNGSGWALVKGLDSFVAKDVIWTGTRFVAVGSASAGLGNAVAATSTDGISWTRIAIPSDVLASGMPLAAVGWDGKKLYATADNMGNKHAIISSSDGGATWVLEYSGTVSGNAVLAGIAASADRVVTIGGVKSVTLP